MIMGQEKDMPVPFYCPRCGGPMYKPASSLFYWHATSHHPPCSITNVAEGPKTEESSLDDVFEAQGGAQAKKKHS